MGKGPVSVSWNESGSLIPNIYRTPGPGHVDAAAGAESDRGHRLQLLAEAAVRPPGLR